jgi:hypothetical protein
VVDRLCRRCCAWADLAPKRHLRLRADPLSAAASKSSEWTPEPFLILPEADQPKCVDDDHQRDVCEVALVVLVCRGRATTARTTILQVALASGRAVGLDITSFNPKFDGDGSIAAAFADSLVKGLRL